MVVKFIDRSTKISESFFEYDGPIGVESNKGFDLIDEYGLFLDKVKVLKHYNAYNEHSYIGVDSTRFMVFLLNNRGQNIQRLI